MKTNKLLMIPFLSILMLFSNAFATKAEDAQNLIDKFCNEGGQFHQCKNNLATSDPFNKMIRLCPYTKQDGSAHPGLAPNAHNYCSSNSNSLSCSHYHDKAQTVSQELIEYCGTENPES